MQPTEPNASNPQSSAFPIRIALTTAAIAVLALIAVWLALAPKGANPSLVGGPFALKDGAGKTVTEQTLRGRPFLVYFGYTHCPDVCPTELAHISDILAAMGDNAVPALFITVDPERDTPKVLADYVANFAPDLEGLTGPPEAIQSVEREYHVYAKKHPEPDGSYSMDHSSIVYLMDRDGRFRSLLSGELTAAQIDDALRKLL